MILKNNLEIEILQELKYDEFKSIKNPNYFKTFDDVTYLIIETIRNLNNTCLFLIINNLGKVENLYLITKDEANKIVKYYGVF